MEFSVLLEERRSIREYEAGVEISNEDIEKMIYAAQQAPSWKNSQTGRYYVAITKEGIESVRKALPEFNAVRTQNASAYIVTAFKTKISGHNAEMQPTDANGELRKSFVPEEAVFKIKLSNLEELGYTYVSTLIDGYVVFNADDTVFAIAIKPIA